MANKSDVNLNIKTTADTKGIDEMKARLDAMQKKADDLLKSSDELKDTGSDQNQEAGVPGGADPEIKEQMSQMLKIQYAAMARDIGQGISSIAKALHDTAAASAVADPALSKTLENTAVGLDSLSLGLTGAAQGFAVGGPMGAAVGGFVGLLAGPLKSAFNDYQESLIKLGEAQKAAEESTQRLKRIQAELAVEMKQQRLDEYYRRELDAIEDVISAIERRARVEASQRSLATATREAGQAEANRDPNMTLAQRTVADTSGDFADAQAKIVAELQQAIDNAAALNEIASDAAATASGQAGISGDGSKEHLAAQEKAQEAQQAAENAVADVEAATTMAENKLAEIAQGIGTRLGDAAEQVQKQAADEAQSIVDKIKESGIAQTGQSKLALEATEKILEDGRVTAAEQQQLQQSLRTLILGWNASITEVQSLLREVDKTTSLSISEMQTLKDSQVRMQQQITMLGERR